MLLTLQANRKLLEFSNRKKQKDKQEEKDVEVSRDRQSRATERTSEEKD